MDQALLLIAQAYAWLNENTSLAVAVGSSLLAVLLLYIDLSWPQPEDEAYARPIDAGQARVSGVTAEVVRAPAIPKGAIPTSAPAAKAAAEPEPEPEAKSAPIGLRDRLAKTRHHFIGRLGAVLGVGTVDQELIDELEALLFTADLGVTTAESLLETVKRRGMGGEASQVRGILRQAIVEKLAKVEVVEPVSLAQPGPHVILVLGVNGSGKTTTIGKLAAQYTRAGKNVVLGAGDTFRAAAAEQLQVWGERAGAEVIVGREGGDPAAVAFDAVKAAIRRKADVCIIDTAGRLQTKAPLMEELAKINRIIGRDLPDAPHECLLVLDSNTGQNAISQAQLFAEVVEITGLVLTKLDGTAKGGVIVGLADAFAIPVRYVGVGEGVDDLRAFHVEAFVDALFDEG